jgi:hypothetical protein
MAVRLLRFGFMASWIFPGKAVRIFPEYLMARLLISTLILVFIAGTAYGKGYEATKKTGAYEVGIRIDRNPPIVGDNNIEIEIKGAGGKSVTDAKVLVNYYMPPMPRMAPMNYKTDAKLRKERYTATMNFIMSGPWYIVIIISHEGKKSTAKFNVDAQ